MGSVDPQLWKGIAMLAGVAFLTAVSQLMLRLAVVDRPPISVDSVRSFLDLVVRILTTPLLFLGFSLQAINGVVWVIVLSRLEVSLAAPIMIGLYFVMLLIGSRIVLGEPIDVSRLAGVAFIGAGIWFMTRSV